MLYLAHSVGGPSVSETVASSVGGSGDGHKSSPCACSIISRQRSDTSDESLATSAQQGAELPDYTFIFLVHARTEEDRERNGGMGRWGRGTIGEDE